MDLDQYIKPWVKTLKPYVPGDTIAGCIKLASNENNYGPSPKVIERICKTAGQIYKYPYKDRQVEEAIAVYCGVEPENVMAGNGSDELIDLILRTFKGPVLSFSPSFLGYEASAGSCGAKLKQVPLKPDFTLDKKAYTREAEDANILFLCSPNNPTGNSLDAQDVKEILDLGKITVVDEAYYEYSGQTMIDLLPDYPNMIILRTFAKSFAIAGIRVGYGIASPEIIKVLKQVKPPFNVNVLAQEVALAALEDVEYMRDCVKKTISDRGRVYEKLVEKFNPIPSDTNFILIDVSPYTAQEFYDKMLEQKIVVRKFGEIKGFPGNYARITIGTSEETQKLLEALDTV